MMGGKNPRAGSRSRVQQEMPSSTAQGRNAAGSVGFDPTRGGEASWEQSGLSPRDQRNGASGTSASSGQSQVICLTDTKRVLGFLL